MAKSEKAPLTFDLNKDVKTPASATEPVQESNVEKRPSNKTASRKGRQFAAAHVKPEVLSQLKMIGIQHDKTLQALMVEAINDLFAKYQMSRIAD